jgi:ketosteroid isomerase-like protein
MSQENVEAAERFIDAYNRRDVEAMLADLDPEIEWHSGILTGLGGEAAVFRGHEGFREALGDLHEALGETHIECSEIRDLGNRVVTIGRFRVRGRESGAGTESPWGGVADFKGGKAIRIRSYFSVEEVLEAAGLSE